MTFLRSISHEFSFSSRLTSLPQCLLREWLWRFVFYLCISSSSSLHVVVVEVVVIVAVVIFVVVVVVI